MLPSHISSLLLVSPFVAGAFFLQSPIYFLSVLFFGPTWCWSLAIAVVWQVFFFGAFTPSALSCWWIIESNAGCYYSPLVLSPFKVSSSFMTLDSSTWSSDVLQMVLPPNFIGDGRAWQAAVGVPSIVFSPHFIGVPLDGGHQWSGIATRGGVDAYWLWFVRWAYCSVATLFGDRYGPLLHIMYCPLNCISCASLLLVLVLSCTF
jgi:hypothetical protein